MNDLIYQGAIYMKFLGWILLCFIVCVPSILLAQQKNADDLIAARKWLSEEEIWGRLEKAEGIKIVTGDWEKLQESGFSEKFIARLREFLASQEKKIIDQNKQTEKMPEKTDKSLQTKENPQAENPSVLKQPEKKFHHVLIAIQPEQAGKVIVTPAPDAQGKIESGTEVTLWPEANAPCLFDHWEGDFRGYQPFRIKLDKDLRLTAVFQTPIKPKKPPKIENTKVFRETRREGYLYKGELIGVVEGKGINKDWGIEGELEYKYIYHIGYTSDVVSNNGCRIRELRTFDTVQETMLISKSRFRLDLRNDFEPIKNMVANLGFVMETLGSATQLLPYPECKVVGNIITLSGTLISKSGGVIDWGLGMMEKITIKQEQIEWLFKKLEKAPGMEKIIGTLTERIKNPDMGRILGYAPTLKLLEGKKFELEYEDGVGLVKVDIADKNQIINTRERELLERAFYLSDYYIFRDSDQPRRNLQIGDTWQVDARTIAGVLEPRLRHHATGRVALSRSNNKEYENKNMAVFKLDRGKMEMVPQTGPQKIEGDVAFREGEILYDLELNYIAKSFFSGIAKYKEQSTDHMLFGTRFSTEPNITIRYECKATKK